MQVNQCGRAESASPKGSEHTTKEARSTWPLLASICALRDEGHRQPRHRHRRTGLEAEHKFKEMTDMKTNKNLLNSILRPLFASICMAVFTFALHSVHADLWSSSEPVRED